MMNKKIGKVILIVFLAICLTIVDVFIGLFILYCSFLFPYHPDSYEFKIEIESKDEINYSIIAPCLIDNETGEALPFIYSLSAKGNGTINVINYSHEWCLFIQARGNLTLEYSGNGKIPQFLFTRVKAIESFAGDRKYITKIDVSIPENHTISIRLLLDIWLNNQETIGGNWEERDREYPNGESDFIISLNIVHRA
ncbi:MAG: hypothetical protein QXD64_04805 [Thermoplasmata archaeon]